MFKDLRILSHFTRLGGVFNPIFIKVETEAQTKCATGHNAVKWAEIGLESGLQAPNPELFLAYFPVVAPSRNKRCCVE